MKQLCYAVFTDGDGNQEAESVPRRSSILAFPRQPPKATASRWLHLRSSEGATSGSGNHLIVTVRPLTENIEHRRLHGIEHCAHPGKINVIARLRNNMLFCIVKDNGIGMPSEQLELFKILQSGENVAPDSGIGIYNIDMRLKYFYGNKMSMRIISFPEKGTTIVIRIQI